MVFHRAQDFWTVDRELKILEWVNQDEFSTRAAREYHEICQAKLIALNPT